LRPVSMLRPRDVHVRDARSPGAVPFVKPRMGSNRGENGANGHAWCRALSVAGHCSSVVSRHARETPSSSRARARLRAAPGSRQVERSGTALGLDPRVRDPAREDAAQAAHDSLESDRSASPRVFSLDPGS
jgi:hypothetical protein